MSLLSRLFGKSSASAAEPEPEDHKGFLIFPEPYADEGGHRVCARIEKEISGEVKSHRMIRADTCADLGTAKDLSLSKARQMIDQMGDQLFR